MGLESIYKLYHSGLYSGNRMGSFLAEDIIGFFFGIRWMHQQRYDFSGGFHIAGVPQYGWLIREDPNLKWMISWKIRK